MFSQNLEAKTKWLGSSSTDKCVGAKGVKLSREIGALNQAERGGRGCNLFLGRFRKAWDGWISRGGA